MSLISSGELISPPAHFLGNAGREGGVAAAAPATGRPENQLVNANIESANHVGATKCIKACRHGQEVQLFFRPNVIMGKKCDLSDFDREVIVGAPQGGLNISETADRDFHVEQSLKFAENAAKNKKTSSEQQFCGQKHLINERGPWRRAILVKAGRKVTVMQITTRYSGMLNNASNVLSG